MFWMLGSMLAFAGGNDEVKVAPGSVGGLLIRLDGALTVVEAEDDLLEVRSVGGRGTRLVQRGGVWQVVSRRPVDSAVIAVPAGISSVGLHGRHGPVSIDVPANVAVVSQEGTVTVHGARLVRVAYLEGDLVVDGVVGDLYADHVEGSIRGSVTGEVHVEAVSGAVALEDDGSGEARTGV